MFINKIKNIFMKDTEPNNSNKTELEDKTNYEFQKDNSIEKHNIQENGSLGLINDILTKEHIYVLSYSNIKKNKEFYMEQIMTDNNRMYLLGLLYSDEKTAREYALELRKSKLEVFAERLKTEDIMDYCNNLIHLNGEGFIINYPYNWTVYKFK